MLDCLLLCIQSNDKEITFHRLVDDLHVYSACILQSGIAKMVSWSPRNARSLILGFGIKE